MKEEGMRGIRNNNLLCYANAALQCLASCDCIGGDGAGEGEGEGDPLVREFCRVLGELRSKETSGCVDSSSLALYMAKKFPRNLQFNGLNDAGEFFLLLADAVTADPRGSSMSRGLFFGKASTSICCDSCKKKTVRVDESGVMTLHNWAKPGSPPASMGSLVNALFDPQSLQDWKCDSCRGTGCVVRNSVVEFPRVLLVTFASGHALPLPVLTMSFRFDRVSRRNLSYGLRGCIVRRGSHYTATVLREDRWWACDDEIVVEAKGPKPGQCLVYERAL